MLDRSRVHWQVPAADVVKINTDSALDVGRQVVGFGIIIRDSLGNVMASFSNVSSLTSRLKLLKAWPLFVGFN
ncbi:hypothetical protein ACOSP7_004520 [Xanthoceras sorbifolium]